MVRATKAIFHVAVLALAPGACATTVSIAVALAVLGVGGAAHAQSFDARPTVRTEFAPRVFASKPALEGYVHNEGIYRITNVRLSIEMLDSEGRVIETVMARVTADVAPGSHGYFIVRLTKTAPAYRVTVVSFDRISGGGA